jgi:hypothetical protein
MWILKESENSRPSRKCYSFPVHCYVYLCCIYELSFLLFLYSRCPEESRSSIAASIIMYSELCAGFSDCNSCVHTSFQCVWCGTGGCSYQHCRENSLNNAAAVGREGTVWTIINTEWKIYTFRTFLLQYNVFKLFSTIGNIYVYVVTLWCVCDHCCTGYATMQYVYIIELDVTVSSIQILGTAQKCFCGEFMWQATIKCI